VLVLSMGMVLPPTVLRKPLTQSQGQARTKTLQMQQA
jgi:hypothetical protein